MKLAQFIIGILMPAYALNSQAVSISQCPKSITVSYEKLQAFPDNILKKTPGTRMTPPESYELEAVVAARNAVATWPTTSYERIVFTLGLAQNAQCNYYSSSIKKQWGEETRLFTRAGRDILRVALAINPTTTVWIYHNVTSYSPQHLQIDSEKNTAGILGDFDHGSPIFYVGSAVNFYIH